MLLPIACSWTTLRDEIRTVVTPVNVSKRLETGVDRYVGD